MADIVINPAIGKIDFFSVKGDNVTNTLKLTGNTLLVTGPLSASSISTGGGGAFVTSVQPTSNYLSKFTGNSTIANSLIYDNGTNVGIGTTTSAARLQINSTTSGATLLRADGTSGTLFTVVDDLSDSLMSVNNSAGLPVLEVFADDRIVGGQYGTNDFVVINNKVGIGTNNPTAKLQVTSSTSTPSAAFLGGNVGIGTTSPTQLLELKKTTGSAIALLNYNDSVKFNINASSAGVGYVGMVSNHDLLFVTNDTERARVTSTGCVGIGTTSVRLNSLLTVYGSGAFGTSAYGFYVGTDATGAFLDAGTQLIRMFTGQQERIRIDANGNVGIGTSSPTSRLHISSSSAADEVILGTVGNDQVVGGRTGGSFGIATKSTSNGNLILTANNGMYLRTGGSNDRLFIASGGNVGIGTTSPISLLDVRSGYITAGTGVSTSGTTILAGYYTSGHLTVLGTEQSSGGPVLGYAVTPSTSATGAFLSSTTIAIPRSAYTQDGGTHRWYTGASQTVAIGSAVSTSEKMRLDTNGNLGIGTSSPATLLHVDTAGADARIRVSAGTNTVQGGMIANSGTSLIYAGSITNHGFSLRTNDTDRVRIDTNGNVGIGTTTAATKFVVAADATDSDVGQLRVIGSTSNAKMTNVGYHTTNNYGFIQALIAGTGYSPLSIQPNGGNVGIGTTAPAYKLDVSGTGRVGDVFLITTATTSDARLEIGSGRSGNGNSYLDLIGDATYTDYGLRLIRYDSGANANSRLEHKGTGQLQLFSTEAGSVTISTTSTERMRVDSSGNVGIGTTSPVSKLHVYGVGTFGSSAEYVTLGSYLDSFSSRYSILTTNNHGDFTFGSNLVIDTYHQLKTVNSHPGMSGAAIVLGGNGYSLGTNTIAFFAQSTGTATANTVVSASVAKMVIQQGGNVGIGTTSPSATLTVIATNNTGSRIQLGTASTSTFMDANKVNDFMVLTAPFGNNPASVSNAGAKWGIKMNGSIDGINTKGKAACIYAVSEDGAGYNRTVGMALHTSGFDLDNAERVRITNGGYVGIGTSTTTSGLQIQTEGTNTASGSFLFVRSTNASFGGGAIGVGYQYAAAVGNNYTPFRIRGGSTNAIFTINSSGTVYVGDTTGAVIYGNHDPYYTFNQDTNTGMDWAAADTLTFKTGGTERLRIDTNGNVGIGTTVQNQKLSIYPGTTGGISLQDSGGTTRSYFFIDNTNPTYSTGIRTTNYYIDFDSSGGAQNAIRFYTGTGAIGTGTERMRVTGTGNIGIGTSSPISKLNAYASGSNLSVLKIDGGNGTLFEVTDQLSGSLFSVNTIAGLPVMEAFSNNRVVMGKYNANDFVISGSRVGIGTSNPSNKTTIEADATGVSFADNGIGQLVIRGATNTAKRLALGIDTTNNIGVIQSQLYGTGQYPLALNPAGGSVGIGTTSPTAKLYVSAGTLAVNTRAMFINADITTNSSVYTHTLNLIDGSADANPTSLALGLYSHVVFRNRPVSAGSAGGILDIYTRGVLTDPTVKMTITDVGNVGIGTTSPSGKLHLDDATAPYITITRTGVPTWQLRNNFPSNQYGFSFNNTTAGTVPLFIGAGGNIGIGLDSPGAKLDIASTQANGIVMRFDTSTNYNAWIRPYWNSNTDTRIDFAINRSAGVTPDVIMSVGYGTNVGIGTTAPVAKLHTVTTTAGSTVIRADGTSGTLFSVVDDLSDSLMSVNNSAGLPVFEVFANDRIVGGQYGVNDFVVINNKVGIGTNNPSGKLHVSGSNATSIIDGLSIGRGSGNVVTNTVIGNGALSSNTTGSRNSAFGHMALRNLTTASDNTAFGYKTLLSGSNGQFSQRNTAMGSRASEAGGGVSNSAFGFEALRYSGFNANSAFGAYTLRNQRTTGTANSNSAFGYKALINNISGYTNSAFGANAGTTVTGGINLTIIGASAEPSSATATNEITLGDANVATLRCQVTTITALSDFRDKTDINDIQVGLSFVEKLRPVTFKWDRREWYSDGNKDGSKKDNTLQVGFIAQELKALQEETGTEYLKLVYESNPDKLEATPGNLMTPLIKAVQELSLKVKTLEAKVQILESK